MIAISTQAPTDADLFSLWLDDAEMSKDPRIVSHLYTAPAGCDLMDREAWATANPALGVFRSLPDLEDFAQQATRLPTKESSFRWLFLNQRVDASAPFVSRGTWKACGAEPAEFDRPAGLCRARPLRDRRPYGLRGDGAEAMASGTSGRRSGFPATGLAEKSKADRVPYDIWAKAGHLEATPGPTVDYDFVAAFLWRFCQEYEVRKIAFDRWNWRHLKPRLAAAGFGEEQLAEDGSGIFVQFGQGFQSMSPALRSLEAALLKGEIAHGNHPVLSMCARQCHGAGRPGGQPEAVEDRRATGG